MGSEASSKHSGKSKPPVVNLRTIAKEAGVSATTVSLALRDDPSISAKTKERIFSIQQSMGYRPIERNRRVPSAPSNRLDQIIYRLVGLDIREDNYAPFLHGIIAACREFSIKLEIGYASDSMESELPGLRASSSSKQGVIISGRIGDKDIDDLSRQGVPFVVLGNYRLSRRVHMVGVDVLDAAERVIEDAVAKGVRSFSVVVEDARRPFDREVLRCIRGTLLDLGVPAGSEIIIEAGCGFSNITKAADQVLARGGENSCVLTLEQHCADQLVMELHSRPPGKSKSLNIVSFVANTHRVRSRHYRIFGLSHDLCGRIAVARLIEIAANPRFPPHLSTVASPGWVEAEG